jgi:hypothetical protein
LSRDAIAGADTAYRVRCHTPEPPSKLSNAELSKMSNAEVDVYMEKIKAEIATMPHPVPKEWGVVKTTPIKITIPERGGNVTIKITDSKTFVQ